MEDFIMSPKVDFAFKELMRDATVRKGFLSAVLDIKADDIKETVLLNTNLSKLHEDEKQGILDVRLTMNNNTEIDIEINLAYMRAWADRSTFYVSKMLVEQVGINKRYSNIKKCIGINILDFDYIRATKRFHTIYHIREDTEPIKYTDILEIHIVELPKLPQTDDGTDLYDWIRFIKAENKGEFEIEGISCPGGWAVYRTVVGQHHDIRQLALRRKIARNLRVVGSVILQIRWSINSRIEYENRFLQFEPHDINWSNVIGISRHKYKTISRVAKSICQKRRSEIDIRTLLFELHDTGKAITGIWTCYTFLGKMRKPYLVAVVVAFHHGHPIALRYRLQVNVLSIDCSCIKRKWPNPSRKELDVCDLVVFAQ